MNPVIIRVAYRSSFLVATMVGLMALSSGALLTTALARAGIALLVTASIAWGMILVTAPQLAQGEMAKQQKPEGMKRKAEELQQDDDDEKQEDQTGEEA